MSKKLLLLVLWSLILWQPLRAQGWKKDSLLRVYYTSKNDTEKLKTVFRLSTLYSGISNDSVYWYANLGMTMTDSLKKDKFYAKALATMANAYFSSGDFTASESYHLKSIALFKALQNAEELAYAYLNHANSLAMQGNYPQAATEGLQAIRYFESTKNRKVLGSGYNLMSAIFYYKGDFDQAIIYNKKALDNISPSNRSAMISPINNLGNIYLELKQYDKAKEYFLQALQISTETGNTAGISMVTNNLGLVSQNMKDWKAALDYYNKSLAYAKEYDQQDNIANAYINIGEVYRLTKDYPKAIEYNEKAKALALATGLKQTYLQVHGNLAEIYRLTGNSNKAYEYLMYYSLLKDTMLNEENSLQINELNTKYETDKKEQELKLKDAQISRQDLEAEKRSLQRNILLVVISAVILMLLFLLRVYLIKKKDNKIIRAQKKEVEHQKEIVEEKQKEILDSMLYAEQIQRALLANHALVNQTIPDSFVVFRPKDIVSGDFYWATKKDKRFYLAVCDSTGHGVPGAFMSLLNMTYLNEAINEKNIKEPNKIFDHVRRRLIENISQNGRQDGMDAILLCFEEGSHTVTYAAANNPPVIVTGGELLELEADKMPIGKGEKEEGFKLRSFETKTNDLIYLYTDGFADQFGGPKGKKFKYRQLDELLLKNHRLPVLEQEAILEKTFEEWRGVLDQVDDVCILGIRV